MPDSQVWIQRLRNGVLIVTVTVALLTTLLSAAVPAAAFAAGTVLFQNAFNNRTVDGTGTVTVATPTIGTNVACLTAGGQPPEPGPGTWNLTHNSGFAGSSVICARRHK